MEQYIVEGNISVKAVLLSSEAGHYKNHRR